MKMQLSKVQTDFIMYVNEENKKHRTDIDVNNHEEMTRAVTLNAFQIYLLSTRKSDQKKAARMIDSMNSEIKAKYAHLWDLIEDKEHFNSLLAR